MTRTDVRMLILAGCLFIFKWK